ncbi:polyprenyl synthetase family protein [Rhodococcus fascians]|nr:polyprenyl synthetase family protein [Rhodococcus fascians]MBY4397755.1 polyprenyl synthetase family protein [Rhodococcus fascians]MBY4406615.1 polyprenyl synthetase family protein [Rhodococcus fascians]MBY4422386.1 polyprenyl synthetase family protein [Rhodococcus fascians]MBY4461881.1 polyprenyl synthetase family protein [Rhodococcus fascians]
MWDCNASFPRRPWRIVLSGDLSAPTNSVSVNATSLRDSVDAKLAEFFASRRAVVDSVGGGYPAAVADLEAFVLRGGKRMRPAFAWTAWLGAGGEPTGDRADAVLSACSALELIQACALIHDDIIDSSRTRRGFPTVHVGFAQRHRDAGWSGSADHFGVSAAVLVGDLALCWADDMLRESGIDTDAARRAQPVWSAMRTEVLGGQLLDIEAEAGTDESVAAAMRVNRYKTAAYTVERPLHLGAVLAGAGEPLTAAYRSFGADIGIAFQLRDDLLGVFGDPEITGKPSGDDITEGKRTVLIAVALQQADASRPDHAARIRASLGTELSESEVADIRSILTELGAVDAVERQIDELGTRAVAALDDSSIDPIAAEHLRAMATAAIQRQY